MKKINISKIIFMILIFIIIICIEQISNAFSFGSVDGIDESRYPGYKSRLQELQKTYPNITVLYTGLDWNTVIDNEHKNAHGRNLVDKSSSSEWICQDCKNNGILYDSGLYCASEQAVRYVMDPRNYLNTTDIFQFQKLNTSVGTIPNEIRIVLQMQKVNYLKDDWDAINAFADVARNNNLNAYHLITRVIQEQGRTGMSILSSGLGYTGNGYKNYGYGYYNLFSINASRGSGDPTYKIYINALDTAAIYGWNSRAASIRGGGNFVGSKYIDVGQNTLYLQKFSVYNTQGQLYWHQYMQNLFGAQNEARILYSLYKVTGIQYDRNFQFIIPIYENMPAQNSRMPGEVYDGYMTSFAYGSIEKTDSEIIGKLIVQEWLKDSNGSNSIQAEPTLTPSVLLKKDNGEYIKCEVEYVEPYIYKYRYNINSINPENRYYVEVQCTNSNNTNNHKSEIIFYNNQDIGKVGYYYCYMTNYYYNFKYNGYIVNYPYTNIELNDNRLSGLVVVQEWLDGVKQIEPVVNPYIYLVAEDGSKVQCEVGYVEPYIYGFSTLETYVDKNKRYTLQVESGSSKNISSYNKTRINYANRTLGTWDIYTVKIENNSICFTYDGYMISYPYEQNIKLDGYKLKGKIVVQEWLNGITQIEPRKYPKLLIKDSKENVISEAIMPREMEYLYSYEIDISKLNFGEMYILEVIGTNPINTNTHQNIQIEYDNKEIGEIGSEKFKIVNGKLLKEEKNSNYDGYMISYPYNSKIQLNGTKLKGQLIVQEWVNGIEQIEPVTTPKLLLKNESGSITSSVNMNKTMPYLYSYEVDLSNMIEGMYYTLEVIGTNPKNISTHQNIIIQYMNQEIGTINSNILKISEGKLILGEKNNNYDGYMISYPYVSKVQLIGTKIKGQLIVQEWVNGIKQIEPVTEPRLVLKDTEGNIVIDTNLSKEMPYLYNYEVDISNIPNGEKLILEVIGTNPKNVSTHQNIEIIYNNQEIENIGSYKLKIEDGKLIKEEKSNKYDGYMISYPYDSKIQLNGAKIKGQLIVQEWINGTVQTEPITNPKIVLQDKDGNIITSAIMIKEMPYLYSYELDISNITEWESYIIQIIGTNPDNISKNQNIDITYSNQEIGTINNKIIVIDEGKVLIKSGV